MNRERLVKRISFILGFGMLMILICGSALNRSRRDTDSAGIFVGRSQRANTPNSPPAVNLSTSNAQRTTPPLRSSHVTHGTNRTLVLLLSYQRSGSSFIGDSLFNINSNAFYIYEPLDQLYSAMYGTSQGWTIPADITTKPDGSLRIPPQEELDGATWMIEALLTCNVSSIPLEIYLHGFWKQQRNHMSSLKPFVQCMTAEKALGKLETCHEHLKRVCGRKFGERQQQNVCMKWLWHDNTDIKMKPKIKQSFSAYDKCVSKYRASVDKCIPSFQKACSAHALHAMKTVRATMDSVEPLLERHPNFKLIHLFRDPRGAVLSRKKAGWARGKYDRSGDPRRIARVYCQTALQDSRRRRQLEAKFPGRTMQIEYGDFFAHPQQSLRNIYGFLNLDVPAKNFLQTFNNRTVSKDSSHIATKWQRELKESDVKAIQDECQSFVNEVGFSWQ